MADPKIRKERQILHRLPRQLRLFPGQLRRLPRLQPDIKKELFLVEQLLFLYYRRRLPFLSKARRISRFSTTHSATVTASSMTTQTMAMLMAA